MQESPKNESQPVQQVVPRSSASPLALYGTVTTAVGGEEQLSLPSFSLKACLQSAPTLPTSVWQPSESWGPHKQFISLLSAILIFHFQDQRKSCNYIFEDFPFGVINNIKVRKRKWHFVSFIRMLNRSHTPWNKAMMNMSDFFSRKFARDQLLETSWPSNGEWWAMRNGPLPPHLLYK